MQRKLIRWDRTVGACLRAMILGVLACTLVWPVSTWAKESFAPGQVLVRYKSPQAQSVNKLKGGGAEHKSTSLSQLDRKFGLLKAENPRELRQAASKSRKGTQSAPLAVGWRVLSFPAKSNVKVIANAYAKDPAVKFAEPNYIGTLGYAPADPAYAGKQQSQFAQLHLEDAWDIQKGGPSVIVAVIDSGVDVNHPDLAGAIAPGGWDFVDNDADLVDDMGHGTRVAGIIAASENGEGGIGAAFGCRILPFDVANDRGQVFIDDLVAAIEEAVELEAQVINLSLSFHFRSALLEEAIAEAAKTAVIVAGVGNDGQGDSPRYPASFRSALGVGAVDDDGGCAIFSNFNGRHKSLVDLVAPGVGVYSPMPGGGWSGGPEASGTSFSAPYVSASAALLRALHPEQSPEAIARHLKKTASRQSEFRKHGAFWSHKSRISKWGMGSWFEHNKEQGSGLVNPYAALSTPMIPTLSVGHVSVVDDPSYSATNDGDGEMDQGETVRLRVEIACDDNDAFDLVTSVTTADPRIELKNGDTTVTEIEVSRKVLRTGRTVVLTFADVYVDPAAGRGDVLFTLGCADRSGALPNLAFSVMIENKIQVSGPQPDIHFTNDYAYVVEEHLTLSGVCLVDPNTPFTIHPGKKITLLSGGSLTAVGTQSEPILFRSLYRIPDLSLVSTTSDRPVAGLSDPHNVGLLDGMTPAELEAQCGPKTVAVNLGEYEQVRYVSAGLGSDATGEGSSSNPWQSIQHGLEQIGDAASGNRYALLVAEGTYSNIAAATGSQVVTMKEWVDLWGGHEASGWTRDIEAYVSIIDGSGANPHRCVNGADNARIDGFTITRGNATDGDDEIRTQADNGGGIWCNDASPTISNNVISGNSAGFYGGGIYCDGAEGSPTISNNVISGNSAARYSGGGIYCRLASPTISNNVISCNTAVSSGGGITCMSDGSPTISNNVISGNSADHGGGIDFKWSDASCTVSQNIISGNSAYYGGGITCFASSPTISNNVISGNSASGSGGGIRCHNGFPTISDNIIFGNSGGGGGIYCDGTDASSTISNNVISGNSGGGVGCNEASPTISSNLISGNSTDGNGGGICCGNNGSPTISSNLISGNSGNNGGGICGNASSPTISSNLISGNSGSSGGGVYCWGASSTTSNNVISGNKAGRGGGIVDNGASLTILNSIVRNNTGPGGQVCNEGTGTPMVSHSNLSDIWSGSGENNVDLDPEFVGVIASGGVSNIVYDASTYLTTVALSGINTADRDLTGWVVQMGPDLGAPTACSYAPVLSYATDTFVLAGNATKAPDGSTISAPCNWQIYDYHLQADSPMKGLGVGPGDAPFGLQVSLFDGDGQPRIGQKCEIGPDESEWETDFQESVWDVFDIQDGASVNFNHVRFENGSGVVLNGSASGGVIEDCDFFQQNGIGLDASGGTLGSLTNVSATANWGKGILAANATVQDSTFERNHDTGLTAASAVDCQSDGNWGHGFDLCGAGILPAAGQNLIADNNTGDGIHCSLEGCATMNSMARDNGGWGILGEASDCDAQNNGTGGIWGGATGCRSIGNGGPGIKDGAQAARCEVRDNTAEGILDVTLVEDCTISGNDGAGISGATQVVNSSSADNGAAGAIGGTFFDTTLSGNLGAGVEAPERLSHCTVARNTGDGVAGTDGTATVNNTLVSYNDGSGLVNLASVNTSNILGNGAFAAEDTIAGGTRDFTGNYWGAIDTDELDSSAENSDLSFIADVKDGSGTSTLDVWPYASETVPEAPRVGGPPYAWRVTPNMSAVTTLGDATFTLTYTASMDTTVEPSVTFGLEDPYQLRVVQPNPGWISPTTWQGTHTIGTQTGDGINTIRIKGAMAADGFPIPDDTSHQFYINTRDPFIANNGMATAIGGGKAHCMWDGPGTASYNLLKSASEPVNFAPANPTILQATEYTVESLPPETLHFFKVQEVEADGTVEDWTAIFYVWMPAETTPDPISMALNIQVQDISTGNGVAGAEVTLEAETTGISTTATNGLASVTVEAIPQTAYTLTVTHPDYYTATRQYTTAASLSDQILLTRKPPASWSMTIHGTVINADGGLPAAGAIVRAQGENWAETLTAGDGTYSLNVSAEPGGFVSVAAVSSGGESSDSAMLSAMEGSQQADFSLLGGLELSPVADVAASELDNISIPLSLSGEAGAVVTLSSRGLPGGAVLDAENLRVVWQTEIGDAGTYYVRIFADSDDGRRGFVEFRITVEAVATHTVTFQTDGSPGATLEGTLQQTVVYGEDCTAVTAHAPAGLQFIRWSKGGQLFSVDNPLTVINVTENMTFTAEFGTVSTSVRGWEDYK